MITKCNVFFQTHSNPCFYKQNEDEEVPVALPKDVKRHLKDGDVFGLLPDKLFFKVVYNLVNGSEKRYVSIYIYIYIYIYINSPPATS